MKGQNGKIKLVLQSDGTSKTYIKELEVKSPLLVQKAIYPDMTSPNMAHLYLMSSSGGILQGDKLDIDIVAGKNTLTHITNQSATKIYKTEGLSASQYISISLENNSYLEFIPNQIIPFKLAKYHQEVSVKVNQGSTLIYSEIISAGRIAFGEKFDFDLCFFRLTAYNEMDDILFTDIINMDSKNKNDFELLFGGKSIWSTIYIISNSDEYDIINSKILSVLKISSVLSGCTFLPNNAGLIVRMLSDSMDDIMNLTKTIKSTVRDHIIKFSLNN